MNEVTGGGGGRRERGKGEECVARECPVSTVRETRTEPHGKKKCTQIYTHTHGEKIKIGGRANYVFFCLGGKGSSGRCISA